VLASILQIEFFDRFDSSNQFEEALGRDFGIALGAASRPAAQPICRPGPGMGRGYNQWLSKVSEESIS
jgi:hypothetical protein